jgi:acetoin utilization deacetylase AcuC-like enzyme
MQGPPMTLLVHYSTDYVAAAHAFDTTRKAAWVADAVRGIEGVRIVAPAARWDAAATEAAIRRVHDAGYVDALATGVPRHLAESQGFVWDPGLWTAVRASTAGVLSAVDAVLAPAVAGAGRAAGGVRLSGSLSSGMHHAKFATGDGFCSVNALVVAAAHAVAAYDADVTVLDVDAHAGGGTDELLRLHGDTLGLARVRHLDLTTKPFDSYTHRAARPGDVNVEDPTLDGDDDRYLDAVDALLAALPWVTAQGSADRPHLVLHNAGMDPSPGISFDALAERERRVAAALVGRGLAGVFVLAGGYTWLATPDEVAAAHASTVRAFAAHATSRTAEGEVSA